MWLPLADRQVEDPLLALTLHNYTSLLCSKLLVLWKMCVRCVQGVRKMCARCVQDGGKVCARCAQDVRKMCVRCAQDVCKMCAK